MPQDNNVTNLIINQLTKVQYQELVENNQLSNNELYIITDEFHYTENEIIALLQNKQDVLSNGEGILISGNTISIDLDVLYKKDEIDTLLSSKANMSETAYKLVYENNVLTLKNKDDETLSVVELYELPDVDKKTISYNEEGNLQAIGERIKSGTIKYTWIGTQEEYEQAKADNVIDEFTEVLITDSISETVTPIVQYDAPTKLSDLANDLNFATQDELQEVKNELDAKIEGGIDDSNFVHLIGNETIDGFKNFKQKIVIENGLEKGRIAHKPVGTSLEDGYIEFGDNTLLYGKQNIQGELYDEKHDIFHSGNLVAGDNIIITNSNGVYKINGKAGGGGTGGGSIDNVDNETIIIQDDGSISAQGVLDQNAEDLTAIKFWSGTLEEYEALGEWDNDTIYNVTDDVVDTGGLSELPIASTDTLGGVKVDGKTIKVTEEGVISSNGGGLEIGDIGIAPLGIDETKGKRRYLNGQVIIQDQYVQFTNKVKSAVALYPSLACTESEWQTTATMTVGGQVGKFVIDNEVGTIRLPKIIMPIQGLTDLSKLGEIVEAGLPNITGHFASATGKIYSTDGAFTTNGTVNGQLNGGYNGNLNRGYLNASLSSPTYGKSNTVQQEQIQYPYFIQVATGAETEDNIINEIELNNPFSLLDYKYSEYELNNISWLRSNGQYNSKAIYPAVYDLLLKIYNGTETKAGVSVKLSTEAFTDYDFVLNTAEETFRLPVKVKILPMGTSAPVYGDGNALMLTGNNASGNVTGRWLSHYAGGGLAHTHYLGDKENLAIGKATELKNNVPVVNAGAYRGVGVATAEASDGKSSGLVADLSSATIEEDLYLYFYVGETVQNANLINAGRIEEKLVNKLDKSAVKAYITETYVSGTSWYRVYSDGWCEQGGQVTGVVYNSTTQNLTFLKPFKDTNYFTSATPIEGVHSADTAWVCNKKTTGMVVKTGFQSGSANLAANWQACGYIA